MKDTLIPLDMVFLKDGRILHVHPNAVPMSEEVISAPQPATHVLEIGGGEAKRLGLAPGDVFAYHLTDTNDKKNVPGESN